MMHTVRVIIEKRRAFTLIELAAVIGIFFLMMLALSPFVHIVKERADRIKCENNLMKISLGLHRYASDHEGRFPEDLGELFPLYVKEAAVFNCPASKMGGTPAIPDYSYQKGVSPIASPDEIVAQDKEKNHRRSGGNVLRANGSIEWIEKRF